MFEIGSEISLSVAAKASKVRVTDVRRLYRNIHPDAATKRVPVLMGIEAQAMCAAAYVLYAPKSTEDDDF